MRVSVVVPVYNTVEYLPETLQSLADQDLPQDDFEVVAVDDGSTDGSGELLDRWAVQHPNMRVLHQPNSGWPGTPRNRGVEVAQGDYVFFMDSDDTLGREALRRMVEFADQHGSDVVVVKHVGTAGRRSSDKPWGSTPTVDADLRNVFLTLMPHKLLRRSFLQEHQLRFPEGKVRLEDGIFLARAYLLARRVSSLGDYPYYYLRRRTGGGNISSQRLDPRGYTSSIRTIISSIQELCRERELSDDLSLLVYRRKALKVFAPDRFLHAPDDDRRAWTDAVRELAEAVIPVELERKLPEPYRTRSALARAGDVAGQLAFAETHSDDAPSAAAPTGGALRRLARRGRRLVVDTVHARWDRPPAPGSRLQVELRSVTRQSDELRVAGRARLRGAPPRRLPLVLVLSRRGAPGTPEIEVPARSRRLGDDGWQTWRASVRSDLLATAPSGTWDLALRTAGGHLRTRLGARGAQVQAEPALTVPSRRRELQPYVTVQDNLSVKLAATPDTR